MAVFIALILCVAVVLVSMQRIPLWAPLLGVAGIVGTYEATYTNAPSQFMHESGTAFTTLLLAAAMGHLAVMIVGPELEGGRTQESRPEPAASSTDSVPTTDAQPEPAQPVTTKEPVK